MLPCHTSVCAWWSRHFAVLSAMQTVHALHVSWWMPTELKYFLDRLTIHNMTGIHIMRITLPRSNCIEFQLKYTAVYTQYASYLHMRAPTRADLCRKGAQKCGK